MHAFHILLLKHVHIIIKIIADFNKNRETNVKKKIFNTQVLFFSGLNYTSKFRTPQRHNHPSKRQHKSSLKLNVLPSEMLKV